MIRRTLDLGETDMRARTTATAAAIALLASGIGYADTAAKAVDEPVPSNGLGVFSLYGYHGASASAWDHTVTTDHGTLQVVDDRGERYVYSAVGLTDSVLEKESNWRRAPLSADRIRSAVDGSGLGDYVAVMSSAGLGFQVETVKAGSSAVISRTNLAVPPVGSQARSAVAATGNDVYAVTASYDEATATQQVLLHHSADIGKTWDAEPLDVLAEAGRSAQAGDPQVTIDAYGDTVVVMIRQPEAAGSLGTILRSDDGGATWRELTELASSVAASEGTTHHRPVISAHGNVVRAAWLGQAPDASVHLYTAVNSEDSWTEAEEVAADPLTETALSEYPFTGHVGSTWMIQALGGNIRAKSGDDWIRATRTVTDHLVPMSSYRNRLVTDEGPDGYKILTRIWYVDRTPPTFRVTPRLDPVDGEPQEITVFARDISRVLSMKCRFDDRPPVDSSSDYCSAPRSQSAGRHEFRVTATDLAGNTVTRVYRWEIDYGSPKLSLRQQPATLLGPKATYRWYASDAQTGLQSIRLFVSRALHGRATRQELIQLPGWARTKSFRIREGEAMCVVIVARDKAGRHKAVTPPCRERPFDDRALPRAGGSVERVSRAGFHRSTATRLRPGGAVAMTLRLKGTPYLRAWACPTCGKVALGKPGDYVEVSLRRKTSGFRLIRLYRMPRLIFNTGRAPVLIDAVVARTFVEPPGDCC